MQQKPKLKPQSADDPGRRVMKAALDTGDGTCGSSMKSSCVECCSDAIAKTCNINVEAPSRGWASAHGSQFLPSMKTGENALHSSASKLLAATKSALQIAVSRISSVSTSKHHGTCKYLARITQHSVEKCC